METWSGFGVALTDQGTVCTVGSAAAAECLSQIGTKSRVILQQTLTENAKRCNVDSAPDRSFATNTPHVPL